VGEDGAVKLSSGDMFQLASVLVLRLKIKKVRTTSEVRIEVMYAVAGTTSTQRESDSHKCLYTNKLTLTAAGRN